QDQRLDRLGRGAARGEGRRSRGRGTWCRGRGGGSGGRRRGQGRGSGGGRQGRQGGGTGSWQRSGQGPGEKVDAKRLGQGGVVLMRCTAIRLRPRMLVLDRRPARDCRRRRLWAT